MRPIDADELVKYAFTLNMGAGHVDKAIWVDMVYAEKTLDMPTVVRCKDCKHSWEDIGGLCCSYGPMVDSAVPKTFFCALGERKNDADEPAGT